MANKRFLPACAALGILILGCDGRRTTLTDPDCVPYCEHSGIIRGKVTVAGDGTPIAGAQVEVGIPSLGSGPYDFSTVTSWDGNYFMRLRWPVGYENPPGMVEITILVSKSGFEPVTRSSFGFANSGLQYDVSLTPTSMCSGPVEVAISDHYEALERVHANRAVRSEGTLPVFSWTPACRLWSVLVEVDSSGDDEWRVVSNDKNLISPPVIYGVTPVGGYVLDPAKALVPGTTYKVSVFRWTGPGVQDGELVGVQKFTAWP